MVGKDLNGTVFTATIDVRNNVEVVAWIKSCVEKEGRLDGGANVAGVGGSSKPGKTEDIVRSPWFTD